MTMIINNWGVVNSDTSAYVAPECRGPGISLQGAVDRHPRVDTNRDKDIVTSPIEKVVGRLVFTQSGSCYKLGTLRQEWLDYMEKNMHVITKDNPIPDTFLVEVGLLPF